MNGGPVYEGPCGWPVSYAECSTCPALDTLESKTPFEDMATLYLWNWTERAFGLCDVSIRPCRSDCHPRESSWGGFRSGWDGWGGSAPFSPVLIGGSWSNISCGACGDTCSCGGTAKALRLPGPIASITQILIDGVALDPSSYRVDNSTLLVRLGGGAWPVCQDMGAASTEAGTWQIDYQRGIAVPVGGQIAAGVLACEMAKAACNDSTCKLPQRLASITRQGVTIAVLDTFEGVDKGKTGIWIIDAWVASVTQPKRGGRVYSVDVPRPRNRTQTWPTPT